MLWPSQWVLWWWHWSGSWNLILACNRQVVWWGGKLLIYSRLIFFVWKIRSFLLVSNNKFSFWCLLVFSFGLHFSNHFWSWSPSKLVFYQRAPFGPLVSWKYHLWFLWSILGAHRDQNTPGRKTLVNFCTPEGSHSPAFVTTVENQWLGSWGLVSVHGQLVEKPLVELLKLYVKSPANLVKTPVSDTFPVLEIQLILRV